ncbi:Hypothetical predicted protein [Paramuricea clavata]|uniref:Uncharacterized protein n=1 Tax=Paramuricea clavata TaxID=317549 RepID=A0A6S7G285_PARCT|nr:Hypothetical predicted protein [Paramuricea clavata]
MSLACEMVRSDMKTGEEVSTIAHFGSKNHKLIGTDDTEETQSIMREKMLKPFSEYQRRGSGWRLRRVTRLEIHIGEFRPLRGMKHEPLPKSIASKKAIINMKNDNDECSGTMFEQRLPKTQSKFFSSLTGEDISNTDYKRAQNVWNTFGMKTMRDYHDLYLKMDVLLLTDIMENFRKVCRANYGLDPLWYYTAPGLAWDVYLKLTEV